MALYLRDGGEARDSNLRSLVENCAHSDDLTLARALGKLVFEAQALADTPAAIAADGRQMVSLVCGTLKSVADDQAAVVEDVCRSHATAIAQTVDELAAVQTAVEDVKAALAGANEAVQAAGRRVVASSQAASQLEAMREHLGRAAAAAGAAQGVLRQCLAAGELVDARQLYRALCLLDKIRRKHLAALLSMLSQPCAGGSSGASTGGGGAKRLSGRELESLQQLHAFFSGLVDDMAAAVQRLALQGFNQWLVSMRACAREVGMAAIQAASVERSLEVDHLAGERRAVLAALAGDGARSCDEIAAELVKVQFRQDLLQGAAGDAREQGGSGGGAGSDGGAERSGGSINLEQPGLRELLGRPPSSRKMQAPPAAKAAAEADVPAELPALDQLHPGDPVRAIRTLIQHQQQLRARAAAGAASSSSSSRPAAKPPRGQQVQQPSSSSAAAAAKPIRSLLDLDMSGLHTAVHIAKSSGQLADFRQAYLGQRRLQVSADLQPPHAFLEGFQAYLAQVAGFFVIESYVQRVAGELVCPADGAALWAGALRPLKAVLEGAFGSLPSSPLMLMVKDFVLLACVALERAGYQVVQVTELLQATCGRYHDLLGGQLQQQLEAAVGADVLGELIISSEQQHAARVAEFGLPWQLEGAAQPPGRRPALGAGGLPPLPYTAPFTSCVPELLGLLRQFVCDSLAYLRGLYSTWELLPAVFHQRDRMLSKVLVEVLAAKARSVGTEEMLREAMKCAANAWALGVALDGLDEWTIGQARPSLLQPPPPVQATQAAPAPAGASASRARNRKAVVACGALSSTVQAALRSLQQASERDVLRSLTARIEQLLEGSRKGDWQPPERLPGAQSSWVDALLSCLQETFEAGTKLLPRSSLDSLMRLALRSTSAACMRAFGQDGVRGYNLYAVEKLATNMATMERFASRWGVASLADELAEPQQLCKLLLSGKLEDALDPQLRRAQYPALQPAVIAAALDRLKELPQQAKKEPGWPTRKAADAVAKQLRAQAAAPPAAAGATAGGGGSADAGGARKA